MLAESREKLSVRQNGLVIYRAGLSPNGHGGFTSNYTRDGIEAGIQYEDPIMLRDQLRYSASKQATRQDPQTGAEPGKYHHESPGVFLRGLSTEYAACDATAWILRGFGEYDRLTQDHEFIREHRRNIISGVDYVLNHLNSDYLFVESPQFAGANSFALKVTYWKDSIIPQRWDGEPIYPVIYSLAHAQNMAGLRNAGRLLGSSEWLQVADKMREGLQKLFNPTYGVFNIAIDGQGPISGVSSDSLSMLSFLEPGDLTSDQIESIIVASAVLETPVGYRGLSEDVAQGMQDRYHVDPIWPVEQARVDQGARKFRMWAEDYHLVGLVDHLKHVEEVSSKVMYFLDDNDSETFIVRDGQIQRAGCDPQLWTASAKEYFRRSRIQEQTPFLPVAV